MFSTVPRRAPLLSRFLYSSPDHTALRRYSTPPVPPKARTRPPLRTIFFVTSAISGGALLGLYSDAQSCPPPPFILADASPIGHDKPPALLSLLRSYLVYGLVSCETIVDHAPEILDALLSVPLVGTVVEGAVRRTFFDHFVGGETAREALSLVSTMRDQNVGALFAYSVEVDQHKASGVAKEGPSTGKLKEQPHKRIIAELIRSVDVVADFEDELGTRENTCRRTWVAIKLTALVPKADALRNLSLYLTRTRLPQSPLVPFPGTPGASDLAVLHAQVPKDSPLTTQDVEDLNGLYHDLNKICTRAKERNVKIIIDAEHSWYQPAIDAFGHALMERFNKISDPSITGRLAFGPRNPLEPVLQPLVYVTYQAYLKRTPTHLARSITLASQNNYALGVKLVRGAYHPQELAAYAAATSSDMSSTIGISPDPYPPVHPSKPDTDACYNSCATLLVRAIADDVKSIPGRPPRIGVIFGTHNWVSSELILGELVNNNLAHENAPSTHGNHKGTLTIQPGVAERLTFAQLHAMSDSLTNYLVKRIKCAAPIVIKYIPYGALAEVMPYISRRAIENKTVLGNGSAARERKEAARLIWREIFGDTGV